MQWERKVLEKEGSGEKDVEKEGGGGAETMDGSGEDKRREAAEKAEDDILTDPRDAFRVWTWLPSSTSSSSPKTSSSSNGGTTALLTLPLSSSFRFDVQFGRRVLAKLLGLEARRDWRDCAQTEAEEEADAGAFKKAFEKWDWTLEE